MPPSMTGPMSTATPSPSVDHLGPRIRDGLIVQALLALTAAWLLCVAMLDGLTAARLVAAGSDAQGPTPSWLVSGGLLLSIGAGILMLIGGFAAPRRWVPALVMAATMLATAAWTLTRYVSFDPYYAPQLLRRYSTGGIVPWGWPVVFAAVDLIAAVLILWRRRGGPAVAGLVLLATPLLLLSYGAGH